MLNIQVQSQVGMLQKFAESLGTAVSKNGTLIIPEGKGKGYLKGLLLGDGMSMMIRNYELNLDMLFIRKGDLTAADRVIFNFNNIISETSEVQQLKDLPTVQIGKGKIDIEILVQKQTKHRSVLIAVSIQKLHEFLGNFGDNNIYKNIVEDGSDLIFEELVTPALQTAANELIACNVPENLQHFYLKIKAEELICLLFAELLKRENSPVHTLNEKDVITVYQIRDRILKNLDTPPLLADLAQTANMSESKLKRLFKQIFGNSIFNYYQSFRMKEAARLLKENQLTVSEVGYQLGFSNLSHFGKIFEEHIGMKPKKWQSGK